MDIIEKYSKVLEFLSKYDRTDYYKSLNFDNYTYTLNNCQMIYLRSLRIGPEIILIENKKDVYHQLINISILSLNILSLTSEKSKEKIMEENKNLFIKKNKDYGSSFEDFGLLGILIRLNDKVNRILNIHLKNNEVKESMEDSINDLYNYCVIALTYKIE